MAQRTGYYSGWNLITVKSSTILGGLGAWADFELMSLILDWLTKTLDKGSMVYSF